ncbi:unnamed protein product [Brassica rapa]|uniref:Uncharacterized protein n=2 Tax=Brassica TaxID=3705 RepID=A0A8D9HYP4_BRACM|nr:unnamed protein product [Brassica napus]CAF2291094.1 unnamed protein product [Brassica napus]CAG7907910.1 unnamed protein product [Brassica rapa]
MQRLSIDASASKLQSYDINDSKRKESLSSPPPPSSSSSSAADYDDHDLKDVKLRRLSSPHQKRENLVHFIPVLTLICFVILYLSSHAPSQSDLAQFNGFMRSSKRLGIQCRLFDSLEFRFLIDCCFPRLESDEDGEISGLMIGTDASAAIRSSIRKLRETESLPRRRTSHRKTADF